jgi:hypothetical protein
MSCCGQFVNPAQPLRNLMDRWMRVGPARPLQTSVGSSGGDYVMVVSYGRPKSWTRRSPALSGGLRRAAPWEEVLQRWRILSLVDIYSIECGWLALQPAQPTLSVLAICCCWMLSVLLGWIYSLFPFVRLYPCYMQMKLWLEIDWRWGWIKWWYIFNVRLEGEWTAAGSCIMWGFPFLKAES